MKPVTMSKPILLSNLLTLSELHLPTEQRETLIIAARIINLLPPAEFARIISAMTHEALLSYHESMSILPPEMFEGFTRDEKAEGFAIEDYQEMYWDTHD